jgi:hypothetical protein
MSSGQSKKLGFMEHVFEAAYRLSGGIGLLMILLGTSGVFMAVSDEGLSYFCSTAQYGVQSLMISALFKIVATLTAIHRLLLSQCR